MESLGLGGSHGRLIFFKLREEPPHWFPQWVHWLAPWPAENESFLSPPSTPALVLFRLVFLTVPTQTGRRWSPDMPLICIPLLAKDAAQSLKILFGHLGFVFLPGFLFEFLNFFHFQLYIILAFSSEILSLVNSVLCGLNRFRYFAQLSLGGFAFFVPVFICTHFEFLGHGFYCYF